VDYQDIIHLYKCITLVLTAIPRFLLSINIYTTISITITMLVYPDFTTSLPYQGCHMVYLLW